MASVDITDGMLERVGDLIADVAREEILPRWRNLSGDQVREKNPGDLVTEADEAAEARLASELVAMFPGTVALGEETVAKNPDVLEAFEGDQPVWVMDPVDGTAAFAAGHPRFTTIVTLIDRKVPVAAWIQAPVGGVRAHAGLGRGAWVNGGLVGLDSQTSLWEATALVGPAGYIPGMGQKAYRALSLRTGRVVKSIGIGADFVDLLTGDADVLVFGTRNPWELPAGTLMIREAGGVVVDATARDFGAFDGPERPLIAAATRQQADATLSAVRLGEKQPA